MAAIAGRPSGSATTPVPLVLRLYPAAWRERYGDEFAELLLTRPPGLRDRFDILRGAIDARVHPQVGANAARETAASGDRVVRFLIVAAGLLLTAWASIGLSQLGRWDSPIRPEQQALLNAAWTAGFAGSILLAIALVRIAARFDGSIGGAGAVGAILTAAGLLFSAFGTGLLGLSMLGLGTLLLCIRLRGRMLGTVPTALLAGSTAAMIGAMVAFAAGGGHTTEILAVMVAYGPAWILVGLMLHDPAPKLVPA